MLNSQYAGNERLKYIVPSLPFMYKTASYSHISMAFRVIKRY